MKTLVTVALLTLMCFLRHSSAEPTAVKFVTSDGCCSDHRQTPIPKRFVKNVTMTPGQCTPKAMVITTVRDVKYCIDPDWDWAKNCQTEFDESSGKSDDFNTKKCQKKNEKV